MDKQPAAARLSAVAAAGCLPTATRGNQSSYTTLWDTTDNHRVLHGRTAFDADSGRRHLQGCYVDRDELRSRLRVLEHADTERAA